MEVTPEVYDVRLRISAGYLEQTQQTMQSLPWEQPEVTGTAETMNFCDRSRPDFKTKASPRKFTLLRDGLVVLYTTEAFLESRSHRFIIPREGGDVRYHREAFFVDCQAIGSRALNLMGLEEISAHDDAYIQFYLTMSDIQEGRDLERWQSLEVTPIRTINC